MVKENCINNFVRFGLPNLNKLNIKNYTGCFIQQIVDALSIANIQIIIYRLGRTCSVCGTQIFGFEYWIWWYSFYLTDNYFALRTVAARSFIFHSLSFTQVDCSW